MAASRIRNPAYVNATLRTLLSLLPTGKHPSLCAAALQSPLVLHSRPHPLPLATNGTPRPPPFVLSLAVKSTPLHTLCPHCCPLSLLRTHALLTCSTPTPFHTFSHPFTPLHTPSHPFTPFHILCLQQLAQGADRRRPS